MTRVCLINLFLLIGSNLLHPLVAADTTSIEYSSPNDRYILKLEKLQNAEDGKYGIVLSYGRTILSQFHYILNGNIVDLVWNPSCSYFAINNRHSAGGDYIWIFHSASGVAVKQPDNAAVQRTLLKIHEKFPQYSKGKLRSHFTFAYKWHSETELLVCTILLFDKENKFLAVVYDTYTMSADGGYSVTTTSLAQLQPTQFDQLPAEAAKIWTGWNSSWWKTTGKEPAQK